MWPFEKKPPVPLPVSTSARRFTREELTDYLLQPNWITKEEFRSLGQAARELLTSELQLYLLVRISCQMERLIKLSERPE